VPRARGRSPGDGTQHDLAEAFKHCQVDDEGRGLSSEALFLRQYVHHADWLEAENSPGQPIDPILPRTPDS